MAQVNQYKDQYRGLNQQRKDNEKQIRKLKTENDDLERDID